MRVALLSRNARTHDALGNQLAERVRFFIERGAEVRLFVEDACKLHPDLRACTIEVSSPATSGPAWDYVRQCDLVLAMYAQHYDLLQWLPCLNGPRVVFDYHGVTPPALWADQHREGLETSQRMRGYVWCADHALATSQFTRCELRNATRFLEDRLTTLPLSVNDRFFQGEPGDRYLHDRLGIAGRIVLYVGRLAGNKRVPLLIEALARLGDRSLHAVLVGDDGDVYAAEAQRCLALAQRLCVADRVHLTGQLDDADLSRAYRSADVLAVPSLHEGFCLPVIEAMACGVPVVASRSAALPETMGAAGLSFTPNDADDFARQLRRVLDSAPDTQARDAPSLAPALGSEPRRIAIVCFRFGPDIVGGAETSLRMLAHALQNAGCRVEIFTTCTTTESHWRNELPAGTVMLDGLTVHRFLIDTHDPHTHGETFRTIVEANGRVAPATEHRYLDSSVHTSALLDALRARHHEFDAIVAGPYLFGLTADVVRSFAAKTLLVPCFHDEPLARLSIWPALYSEVGGILYHSPEEQTFAQCDLGVHHPNSSELGTWLPSVSVPARTAVWEGGAPAEPSDKRMRRAKTARREPRPPDYRSYLVYCGRYSGQKNVPLLLDWLGRYQAEHPGRFDIVFMGGGEAALPREPWLEDLGRVDEPTKRAVLAGAKALVQLSTHESLSIVVLEAWAAGTPVIVHRDCPVLVGQIARAQGGAAVSDYASFADTLDDLVDNTTAWHQRGTNGQAYVAQRYGSSADYLQRLQSAVEQMRRPLADQMRARGLAHARTFTRECWQRGFQEMIEKVLTQPARPRRDEIRIEPLRQASHVTANVKTLLIPVRLTNAGTHAAVPVGPGRTVICGEVRAAGSVVARRNTELPTLLMPGQAHVAAVPITVPGDVGAHRLILWAERAGRSVTPVETAMPLTVGTAADARPSFAAVFLDTVQETLPRTRELGDLPADYVDVTEGRFASAKRFVKRKLLNNFKQGYVDVLSRRQSQVNGQFVVMIQQLAECCAVLEHAVTGLHQRLDAIEARLAAAPDVCADAMPGPAFGAAAKREKGFPE